MARKARDYKAEYAQRIAKGLAAGKTRAQARGHGGDRKGRPAASNTLAGPELKSYLGKLRGDRNVKVMATTEDGRTVTLARGKARNLLDHWTEWDAEGGPWEWDTGGYGGRDDIVIQSVQVIYE